MTLTQKCQQKKIQTRKKRITIMNKVINMIIEDIELTYHEMIVKLKNFSKEFESNYEKESLNCRKTTNLIQTREEKIIDYLRNKLNNEVSIKKIILTLQQQDATIEKMSHD